MLDSSYVEFVVEVFVMLVDVICICIILVLCD